MSVCPLIDAFPDTKQTGVFVKICISDWQPIVNVNQLYMIHANSGFASFDPVPEVPPVITLSHKDPVILRKGDEFKITCSSSNVNTDFSVKWDFPSTAVRLMKRLTASPQSLCPGD